MNAPPPHDDLPDQVTEAYRRRSALEDARPRAETRRRILAEASRAARTDRSDARRSIQSGNWKWKAAASIAVVGLLGVLSSQILRSPATHHAFSTPVAPMAASTPTRAPAASPAAPTPQTQLNEVILAGPAPAAPAAKRVAASSDQPRRRLSADTSTPRAIEPAPAPPAALSASSARASAMRAAPLGSWVAGKNYQALSPAQPTDVPAGKVEVIEFFRYACPDCFALEPTIQQWRAHKSAYIQFRSVPVTWNEEHRAHAHLFYTLQALGKLDALQGQVFNEIQERGDLLYVPGDEQGTLQKQLQFAKAHGISESDFIANYNDVNVKLKVQQADDLARRYKVDKVPTFAIDGKYITDATMAGGGSRLIQLIDDLAASESHPP
jgi:protein dithiol oxidoreductase (disulfide-forming)